jgi:hypothetical protein
MRPFFEGEEFMRPATWALIAWLGLGLSAVAQTPQPTPTSSETAKPELSPSPPGAKAYFVDLKDGATIAPKTTIHFGLSGMGVAPAGVKKANSGHFHLLIDEDTPPLDQPIPNNENNLHFGAGQTETTITLPVGKHTLQLLMGDANHVPHSPPVMSPIIHVTVAEPAATPAPAAAAAPGGRHPSPKNAKVYIVSPANGAYVPTTFTVRFGLVGMGVAPAGIEKPNSGHHHLIVDGSLPPFDQPIPNNENYLHFGAGQTEASVTLPKGKHTLQLLFGDAQHIPHDPPLYSQPIVVYVGMTPPRRRLHHPHHHNWRPHYHQNQY